jgi:hypothetical protein
MVQGAGLGWRSCILAAALACAGLKHMQRPTYRGRVGRGLLILLLGSLAAGRARGTACSSFPSRCAPLA